MQLGSENVLTRGSAPLPPFLRLSRRAVDENGDVYAGVWSFGAAAALERSDCGTGNFEGCSGRKTGRKAHRTFIVGFVGFVWEVVLDK